MLLYRVGEKGVVIGGQCYVAPGRRRGQDGRVGRRNRTKGGGGETDRTGGSNHG